MKRILLAAVMPLLGLGAVPAQSLDDLNVQVHGYATQGFIYSTKNNWNTTNSSKGTAAWTEAVLNVTAQPDPKVRLAVQGRYFLLGTYGNQITLDFASADFKLNEHFGLRAGKVKSPLSLLNESQDIDPAQLWVLLPQSVYPIASRNTLLAHYGAVFYGKANLSESLGTIDYRAYGGQRFQGSDDGYLQGLRDRGDTLPNGVTGPMSGVSLRWRSPLQGLIVGATVDSEQGSGTIVTPHFTGKLVGTYRYRPFYFAQYEHKKLMLAGEYSRLALRANLTFPGIPLIATRADERLFYVMGSYKLATKLTGGLYYSSAIDHEVKPSSRKYQKDWALSTRYDFNPFLYAKVEEHFVDGTLIGYSSSNNPNGLKPNTLMTFLKVGVSF